MARWPHMTPRTRFAFVLVLSMGAIAVVAFVSLRHPRGQPVESMQTPMGMRATSPRVSAPNRIRTSPTPKISETVAVCGYGDVPVEKGDTVSLFRAVRSLTKGAATSWVSNLQNSDDLRARMAGLLLEDRVTGGEALQPVSERTQNEAVQLAAGTQDPAVYAMALAICDSTGTGDSASPCRRLSIQQWTQLDPDNAAPWLLLAGRALANHDSNAQAEAFSHAARAHRIESYRDSVFAFAEPELPADVTPLARAYFATEVNGVTMATKLSQYTVAGQYCSSESVKDSSVRHQCDSLAELLVSKGNNLLDLGLGTAIGARVGWSASRLNSLRLEQHALMEMVMQGGVLDSSEPWSCEAVGRADAYTMQRHRLGELGALRGLLEHSGESIDAMAEKYTQHIDSISDAALRQAQESQLPMSR
jgi:hypothetical protein